MNTRMNKCSRVMMNDSMDSVEAEFTMDYCMKENTRRIKRSHERKPKYVPEESDDEEESENNYYVTMKKDNSRRARREAFIPEKSNKKVTFAEPDYDTKPFRIPSGRYVKKMIADERIEQHSSNSSLSRRSKRLLKTEIKNYYESEDEEDEEKEENEE